ncbi:glycosyltransferase [Pedobacter agri]|uniref:glycosyltransferase n=1 Tax=Pedobacter agri TaxID=454586 RepID=UPI00278089C2|nr:glycosyltransferase [Pedobacter agri]MDQ1141130.1 GT2 family glycosyltransferase [Pedobacter agri]
MINGINTIFFGIVTYREKYDECDTFKSLIKSFESVNIDEILYIYIYDNTPDVDWKLNHLNLGNKIRIKYFTENENKGIAYAYNYLAKKAIEDKKEWFVILDQDTILPNDFYLSYRNFNLSYKILCPKIYVGDKLISPAYYHNYRSFPLKGLNTDSLLLKGISFINSGLLVNLQLFNSIGGYNEHLKLDFCDHDFIERIKSIGINEVGIIKSNLVQNFSFNTHDKFQALNRYIMFLKDYAIYDQNKNSLILFLNVGLPHLIKLSFKYKTTQFIRQWLAL